MGPPGSSRPVPQGVAETVQWGSGPAPWRDGSGRPGCPQCCVRHSEAFSRVRLARCGGSRHVKLGDIKLQGDGAPQSFLPCPALSSLGVLCWGLGPSSQRGHVAGLQTDPRAGLGHQRGHTQHSHEGVYEGSGAGPGRGTGVLTSDLGRAHPGPCACPHWVTHKAGVVLCVQVRRRRRGAHVYSWCDSMDVIAEVTSCLAAPIPYNTLSAPTDLEKFTLPTLPGGWAWGDFTLYWCPF